MNYKIVLTLITTLLLFSVFVHAAENKTLEIILPAEVQEVEKLLNTSQEDLNEMINDGFNVIRFNDTWMIAKQMYDAQVALLKAGGGTDFQLVYEKIDELNGIKRDAYIALDELTALESTIEQTGFLESEPVLELYNQAKESFDSERYEETLTLIEKTYEKISELEAFDTKVKAFYEATSRSLLNFIKTNWKILSTILIALIIIITITYSRVSIYLIKKKIEGLELRRETIKKLTAQTQKDYFEAGRVNETTYKTRTKKYAELIRDINRQIPLLKEELEIKLRKKNKRGVTNEKGRKD